MSHLWHLDALTPTVKLNGLAMKRGEMAHYKMVDRKPIFHNNQSYNPQVIFVSLSVFIIALVCRWNAPDLSER